MSSGMTLFERREKHLRENIPDLFGGVGKPTRYKSVLYVGANSRRQHFLPDFIGMYERIVVIEIFEANAQYNRKKYAGHNTEVITGDVRNIKDLTSEKFDVCFFWHGPEHLSSAETKSVLDRIESVTNYLIVLGMPHGRYDQGPEYGNDHEEHLQHLLPADMENLGYSASAFGEPDDRQGNLLAWKRLG